jgi:plastocyanin
MSVLAAVMLVALLAGQARAEACYSAVKDIPATCTGGSITSDTSSGTCRTITCQGQGHSLTAKACDKPDVGTKQYFEMYKQASVGTGLLEICIGQGNCIKENGYDKSPNYPICTGPSQPVCGDGVVNDGTLRILRYEGYDASERTAHFKYIAGNSDIYVPLTGDDGYSAFGDFVIGGDSYRVLVSPLWFEDAAAIVYVRSYQNTSLGGSFVRVEVGQQFYLTKGPESCDAGATLPPGFTCVQGCTILETAPLCPFRVPYLEGQTRTYNAGPGPSGKSYETTLVFVSNPGQPENAKLSVNGMLSPSLSEGQAFNFGNGAFASMLQITQQAEGKDSGIGGAFVCLNLTPENQSSTCFSSVKDIPASCTGGTVTQDTMGGTCRTLVCTNGGSSLKVLACDKPDQGAKQFFEMYKQQKVGSAVSKICIGETCIEGNGYAKSPNFPICTGSQTQTATVIVNPSVTPPSEPFTVAKPSVDHNVVVQCQTSFVPDEFVWNFGDGTTRAKNAGTVQGSLFWSYYAHTYANNGTYNITCTAKKGSTVAQGSALATIKTEATPAEIAATLDSDTNYDPFVFRPLTKQIQGSTFRFGGYSVGLPRNPDQSGQSGFWLFDLHGTSSGTLRNDFTSNHPSILNITFPEPGTYSSFVIAGIESVAYRPSLYILGIDFGGCSNSRSVCVGSDGEVNLTVPDLGTRSFFGIETEQTEPLTYNVRCVSYASDAGMRSSLAFYNASGHIIGGTQVEGNAWASNTFPRPGTYEIVCLQDLMSNGGLRQEYRKTLEVTGEPPGGTCVSSVKDALASCTGGSITQDSVSGACRTLTCANGAENLKVLACDKPDVGAKQFFEMYKQSQAGSAVSKICLGSTCIEDNGYAKSQNFPICA